jgi:hypothetical protein
MPYDREAAVELSGFQGTLKVYYTEEKRKPDEGRFFAKYTSDTLSPMEPYHVFLDTKGTGHYVGTILLAQGIHQDGTPFFEGDDSTATDGVFRMHGTGSEDYFNGGWYDIKGRWDTVMNLPLHGCLGYSHKLSRTGGYRFYLADKMPFENSIFECIEHGRTASGVPAYYVSIALYYKK